ncbi:zinc transporter 41F isoform X2 [Haematobia irritans]|uniref:zinc transporter 41F isoform X2 n=1 Tax=Haematobia irritans TaxID=7368 RepID=UPI003F50BB45
MSKYQKLTNNDSTATLTDDENFAIFSRDCSDDHHHNDDDNNAYQVEDLFQYNDTTNNNNKNSMLTRSAKNSYNQSRPSAGNGSVMNDETLRRIEVSGDSGSSNSNLLIIANDFDDSTMEIPLLQHGSSNGGITRSYKNNQDDLEYGCLCQQKGFASNLNNNSTKTAKSKILWAVGMCCIFMIVEFLGGYIAGSLAIMTDAAHLASDCISFVIGLVAICLGSRPPDAKMSFGYKRVEVMGALASILGIWILTATLVLVAIQRVYANDYDLDADTMMVISGIGILINIVMIFILHTSSGELPEGGLGATHGHSHSHNHGHNHSHNHHGHSHSSPQSHSTQSQHSHLQASFDSNHHLHVHSECSAGSIVASSRILTGNSDSGRFGTTLAVDTSTEATSQELSAGPLLLDGNGLEHQQDGHKNLNLRAAMIHAIGDLVQSSGVFIASIFIKLYPTAVILDPLCTLLFSVIVIMTTLNLFKESIHILMDSVPQGFSMNDLEMDFLDIEGVKSVHHLNVWSHTSNHNVLMAHLVIDFLADSNSILMQATQLASGPKYNVKHSTIQIERVTS